jgi:microcystin degradation protein MlrC
VRFVVGMFTHETNTFRTIRTDRHQVEARDLRSGGVFRASSREPGACPGGILEAAA